MMPNPQPGLLSVVIPNWNGAHFLSPCLDSLTAQTYAPIEIIIADNASTDGSLDLLRDKYPDVTVLALPENRGFTGACNAGIEAANGEFICLLNNDTEVDTGWAEAVIAAFADDERIGSVASKMLLYDKRDHIHTTGDLFTVDGRAVNRGVWQLDSGQYDRAEDVFSACGGSAVYRRTLLDDVGLLDDDFFFSGEDVDIGWRAQLRGWRCLYTPDAVVYHHLSATGGGVTSSYYDGRNALFILVKDVPGFVWRRYGWRIIIAQAQLALEAARAWRGEAARARLRGMVAGLRALPHLLAKRRQTQRTRRVADVIIEQRLSPPQS
ncbi:MAG: glycosyltransferase family 2 protein [Chloroflexota bacterium]